MTVECVSDLKDNFIIQLFIILHHITIKAVWTKTLVKISYFRCFTYFLSAEQRNAFAIDILHVVVVIIDAHNLIHIGVNVDSW